MERNTRVQNLRSSPWRGQAEPHIGAKDRPVRSEARTHLGIPDVLGDIGLTWGYRTYLGVYILGNDWDRWLAGEGFEVGPGVLEFLCCRFILQLEALKMLVVGNVIEID
jgi:hypothetical protein